MRRSVPVRRCESPAPGCSRRPRPSTPSPRRPRERACVADGRRASRRSRRVRGAKPPDLAQQLLLFVDAERVTREMARRELRGRSSHTDSREGGGARRRVDLERTATITGGPSIRLWRRSSARDLARARRSQRGAGHVVGARAKRAQQRCGRLAARAHPQDADTGCARSKLAARKAPSTSRPRCGEPRDNQVDLTGLQRSLSVPGWLARWTNSSRVRARLPAQRLPAARLHEQHAATSARNPGEARDLAGIVDQSLPPCTEEGLAREHVERPTRSEQLRFSVASKVCPSVLRPGGRWRARPATRLSGTARQSRAELAPDLKGPPLVSFAVRDGGPGTAR